MPPDHPKGSLSAEANGKKKEKPVDWVAYFGGKPPTEIITIHDDDSPAPPSEAPRPPPPSTTNGTSAPHHVDKRRRMNGAGAEAPTYSTTNTPYSYTNGTSTESLQTTTAATSLASQASSAGKVDDTQTGQKRKRTTRTSEQERKRQETERSGHQGYLAEYGEYIPPPKQHKKQRDVAVPAIADVRPAPPWCWLMELLTGFDSVTRVVRRSTTKMAITWCTRTVDWVSDTPYNHYLDKALSAKSSAQSTRGHGRRWP